LQYTHPLLIIGIPFQLFGEEFAGDAGQEVPISDSEQYSQLSFSLTTKSRVSSLSVDGTPLTFDTRNEWNENVDATRRFVQYGTGPADLPSVRGNALK
jgi:hypothetical protein